MSDNSVTKLLQIEQQVRCCETATELNFVMVNASRNLVVYEQATYLAGNELEALKLQALSDVPLVDRTTPFSAWIEQVASLLDRSEQGGKVHEISVNNWPNELKKEVNEFTPPHMLWLPLFIPSKPNERVGVLVLAKSTPWSDKEIGLLQHLSSSYAHAMQLFIIKSGWKYFFKKAQTKKTQSLILVALLAISFIPVRLAVLAPSEIIAKDPHLVMSAIAGVVSQVLVKPGDKVSIGRPLVLMDKTDLQGSYDIALRELQRAKAELRTSEQAGYVDRKAKSQLVELESQVALKQIELNYVKAKLAQTDIHAKKAGLVVLDDPEKWKGRPVVVGERIFLIADPANVELEVMLPVKDAISLNHGDRVTFYLDTDPLNPIQFSVNYSSFESSLTPNQTIAYRINADINEFETAPRIGLRGVAKLYGEEVTLAYYVFRRPITFVRQNLGW